MADRLLEAVETSDVPAVTDLVKKTHWSKRVAWATHLSLFPVAQRVLNPPYINPHVPKMYAVIREVAAYLGNDLTPLIALEVNEYAHRAKANAIPKPQRVVSSVSFDDVQSAIGERQIDRSAELMHAFLEQNGRAEFARRVLLLGSGYLDRTLGHSVSCTAFILLEMIERPDEEAWPAIATLADYFCKGRFRTVPELVTNTGSQDGESILKATSGEGIVNLHHTITRYAIERVKHLLSEAEYHHMLGTWLAFMGDKSVSPEPPVEPRPCSYADFRSFVARGDAAAALSALVALLSRDEAPTLSIELGTYLIRAVSDLYNGEYDPHFLTGLGSALWVVDNYRTRPEIATSALRQYLNYYIAGRR